MGQGQKSYTISPYPVFVIGRLKGTYGNSESAAVDFILKDWIRANPELMKDVDATVKDFRRETETDDVE